MENKLPVISKRVWSIVRVAFFMLRKGFTNPKLLMHLNLMLKRPGKIAGKAFGNLISHHRHCHHGTFAASHDVRLQFSTAREYEFSCSNTANNSFFSKRHIPRHLFACAHAPLTLDDEAVVVNNALNKVVMEMMDDKKGKDVAEASLALPMSSGRTRTVTQVRVTDSPFPVQDGNDDGDHQVDQKAEEFIERVFKELRKQG